MGLQPQSLVIGFMFLWGLLQELVQNADYVARELQAVLMYFKEENTCCGLGCGRGVKRVRHQRSLPEEVGFGDGP